MQQRATGARAVTAFPDEYESLQQIFQKRASANKEVERVRQLGKPIGFLRFAWWDLGGDPRKKQCWVGQFCMVFSRTLFRIVVTSVFCCYQGSLRETCQDIEK